MLHQVIARLVLAHRAAVKTEAVAVHGRIKRVDRESPVLLRQMLGIGVERDLIGRPAAEGLQRRFIIQDRGRIALEVQIEFGRIPGTVFLGAV